jgi:hypothetical protein
VTAPGWDEPTIRAAFAAVTYTRPDDGGYAVDQVDVDDLITELRRRGGAT